jgi:pimeloyl-ACP methyl ester carboxylesterase
LLDCQAMVTLPALDGVDAAPAEGPPVVLVQGFRENWWELHELIGPLAADGYRVLCPDLRGAGWSSAPRLFVLPPPERPLALPAPSGWAIRSPETMMSVTSSMWPRGSRGSREFFTEAKTVVMEL